METQGLRGALALLLLCTFSSASQNLQGKPVSVLGLLPVCPQPSSREHVGQGRRQSREIEREGSRVGESWPVGRSEQQRGVGEWGLARASMRPGRRAQEVDARAARLSGARASRSAPGSERAARRWVHRVGPWAAWSPGCCWLSEDRVGVGTERSGLSRRSAAGMGLWVWER